MLKNAMDANIDYRQSREYKNKYYANGAKRPCSAAAKYTRECPNGSCVTNTSGIGSHVDGVDAPAGRFPYRGRDVKRSVLEQDGSRTYYVACPFCGTEVVHEVKKPQA